MHIDTRHTRAVSRRAPAAACGRLLVGALALLAGACATGGLPEDPVLKEYEPKRWVGTPKSGLRVIVQEDHTAPLVSIVATYGVGSTSDPKGKEGLAHFVEHLVFRSKPFGGEQQYWDFLQRMGGNFNATTWVDFTNYFTTAHKSNLPMLLQLEAWRLSHTLDGVTPGAFAVEREVVRNELRLSLETTAGSRMFDTLFDALYPPGHPLSRPTVGTHDSLNAAKLEDAQAFVKKHYSPDNCTIVVVGDVTTEEVKKLMSNWPVEVLFGPGGPEGPAVNPRPRVAERPAPEVPAVHDTSLRRQKAPIEEHTLLLGWSLPPGLRGKDSLASFAAQRLNGALGALDFREEDDIITAGAGTWAFGDSSVMFLQAILRPWADPEKARQRLLDVLMHAWDAEASKQMTEMTRWRAATQLLRQSSRPLYTAAELSEYMAATGKHTYFKDHFEELASIKAGEVTDFAYKWLNRKRAAAVYFEPDSDKMPTVLAGGGAGAGASAAPDAATHNIGRGVTQNAHLFTTERLRQVVKPWGIAQTPHFTTSNGLEVYVLARPEMPVASIDLNLKGGDAITKPPGVARYAGFLASSKCDQKSALGSVGGSLGSFTGLTSGGVFVNVLAGNIANGMSALHNNVSCMEVDDEVFLHLPRILRQEGKLYEHSSRRPEFVAAKWFYEQLYPNHPYSQVPFLNPATLQDMRPADAQSFLSSHYRPDNGVAVVYGGITVEEVKAAAEKHLANWKGGGGASMTPVPATEGPTKREIHLVNRPGATQAQVQVGCRLEPVKPDKLPAYDVLQAVARESAWVMREQWGATYGIGAGVAKQADNSAHFQMSGAVVNAQAGKAVARLLQLIELLANAKVSEPLFLTKRWDVGREYMTNLALADSQAGAIAEARQRGWPLEVWDKYPENLANTTQESLKEIMAPCLTAPVMAIVGDAAVLKPQLEQEGLKLSSQ